MYAHALRLSPDDLEAYASLAYIEMLQRGYTAVGEFHYLHHSPSGAPYSRLSELSERLVAAADATGIALTLLPALYTSGGVGRDPLPEQRRFVTTVDQYLSLVGEVDALAARRDQMRVGVAPHSLRAVRAREIQELAAARPDGPIHIHAAERVEEIAELEAALGARPVAWLLEETAIGGRWCVVHATHMHDDELRGLAASGAVAGLCPLTEANLGDGRFELASYRHHGGRVAVGTDANHLIDLAGELRMLEYGQRLHHQRRDTLLADSERSVADVLYSRVCDGGAQALQQPCGRLERGYRCDLVELDPEHPALVGQRPETILDAWVFSTSAPDVVRTVLVGGREVVAGGRHPHQEEARARVGRVMRRLHGSA
jgi:formimidoylglutamate deiminase